MLAVAEVVEAVVAVMVKPGAVVLKVIASVAVQMVEPAVNTKVPDWLAPVYAKVPAGG